MPLSSSGTRTEVAPLDGIPRAFEILNHVDPGTFLNGVDILYGKGRLRDLGTELDQRGLSRALIVCGPHVAANHPLQEQLRECLGRRLVGIFPGTSPRKTISSVYSGIDRLRDTGADVLVGIGGGSSLDTARQISVFASDGRPMEFFREAAMEDRLVAPICGPESTSVVLLPTTLAGADLSSRGSISVLAPEESPTGQPVRTNGIKTPTIVLYDPDLYGLTPGNALRNSAMNGFDKGIETIYAPTANPITDATSVHGLRLMASGLAGLVEMDEAALSRAVSGLVLVQLRRVTSIIHAFGHGIARHTTIQQGAAHSILAPHVLQYVLSRHDGRRRLMAEALGIDIKSPQALLGASIVERVVALRDAIKTPARWSDLPEADDLDFAAIAEYISKEGLLRFSPVSISAADAEEVLRLAA